MFIQQVKTQLTKMSDKDKDDWILNQAKLIHESKYQDFLQTLSGEKKIIYMPSRVDIGNFCKKVKSGEIYVEYMCQYYEFYDGKYVDDWKVWYEDPFHVLPFLERIFKGCHDLVLLEEYKTASDILDNVCSLEFKVVNSPNSSEYAEFDDTPFTLIDANKQEDFSVDLNMIGMDWILSYIKCLDYWSSNELAEILVMIYKHPICQRINPEMIKDDLPNDMFLLMQKFLYEQILEAELYMEQQFSGIKYSHQKHLYENKLRRMKELSLNIQMKCIDTIQNPQQTISSLSTAWKQIQELVYALGYAKYIDDQWEIEEIYNICELLIKKGEFDQEEWNLRRSILADIIQHDYYNHYGCYDPMKELSTQLCLNEKEFLALADIMDSGYMKKEAAYLYHKYGRDDKYVLYLESNLNDKIETYVDLINFYKTHDNIEKARQAAEQALVKCRKDLTEIFIFLLTDAKNRNDTEKFKKLYSSAKRRKSVNIHLVDQALKE